jgi:hypothetical protein
MEGGTGNLYFVASNSELGEKEEGVEEGVGGRNDDRYYGLTRRGVFSITFCSLSLSLSP